MAYILRAAGCPRPSGPAAAPMLRGKAGVLSDQLDRRRLLITADLIAAAAGAVAVIAGAGRLTPTGLIVLSLGIGTAAAVFNPAYGPLLSHTVPTEQLARANGLDAAVTHAANLTAPALGGWLYRRRRRGLGPGRQQHQLPRRHRLHRPAPPPPPATHRSGRRAAGRCRSRGGRRLALPTHQRLVAAAARPGSGAEPVRARPVLRAPVLAGHQPAPARDHPRPSHQHPSRRHSYPQPAHHPPTPARPGRRFTILTFPFPAALVTLLLCPGTLGVLAGAGLVGAGMAAGTLENLMLQTWVPDHLRGRVYAFDVLVSLCAIPLGYLLAGLTIQTGTARTLGTAGALACVAATATALGTPLARRPLPHATWRPA
jgi:hypothetical protein